MFKFTIDSDCGKSSKNTASKKDNTKKEFSTADIEF